MYNNQTYELIKARILDSITANIDKREGSFIQDMISPIATEITKAYIEFDNIINIAFVENSYDEYLDMKVNEFGVYRKEGVKSTGIVKITGVNGTVIPSGTVAITTDGLRFILSGGTITNGVANIVATSDDVGKVYNILASSISKLGIDIFGVDTVTNETIFTGGIDRETDEELKARFFITVQKPVTSGNKYHYEQWALEVDGIGNATVVPLWNGAGTVKVLVSDSNKQPVTQTVLDNCKSYIESQRPIGATVTVITPTVFNLTVSVDVTIDTTRTLTEVTEDIRSGLISYFKTCTTSVVYNKVGGIIAGVSGVVDYTLLKLNNTTANVTIPSENIINLSSLVVS